MAIEDKDLLEEALGRVLEQLKSKENFEALLTIYTAQAQAIQTMFLGLLPLVKVAEAEGDNLDVLGTIVGEARNGRTDTAYRVALLARIRLNLSRGTAEDVIGLIRAVMGDVAVEFVESEPAAFVAYVPAVEPSFEDAERVGFVVAQGRAAGVGGGVHFHIDPAFTYDGDADEAFDAGHYADIF